MFNSGLSYGTANTVIVFGKDGKLTGQVPTSVEATLKRHENRFSYKPMETLEVLDEKTYFFVGLGESEKLTKLALKKAVGKAIKYAKGSKVASVALLVESFNESDLRTIAETVVEADHSNDLYKSDRKASTLEEVTIVSESPAVEEGFTLGHASVIARDLVNEPANVLTPIELANRAKALSESHGLDYEVFDEEKIQSLDMKAYWEVAKASYNKPRFIIMKHMGNPDSKEILGLVGKGLTYDSGGYSIKSKEGMITMKSDMGGSAAVLGAMSAIAEQNLKINVIAVVAACENMISGGGYRPGDIIGSRGGKSIFIQSTDAEGRLTLIDAVDYIIKDLKATKVIDIATLTGACLVALGKTATGTVSNNDEFHAVLDGAVVDSGERVWRMPMFPEYKEILKHKEADLTNATRMAGMITAGMFIGEFVGETPWIHMDIAGPSWTQTGNEFTAYGGTGVGVKNLYYIAKAMQ
jgi:leucyl aminopeptidase